MLPYLKANKKGLSFERPFVFGLRLFALRYSSSTKGGPRLFKVIITAQLWTNGIHAQPAEAEFRSELSQCVLHLNYLES